MAEAFGITVAENAVGTVAGNWLDQILKRISNPIILIFRWKANVENLKRQVALLKQEEQSVEHHKQAVERRGEDIEQKLKTWLTRTSTSIEGANPIEDDEVKAKKKCFFGMCFNPLPRYNLSKKAVEDSKDIANLVREAREFNLPPSYTPIPQRKVAAPVKGFQEFDSRMSVLDEIMEALQSPSISTIGLHGMPGVGKTMLLKEVKRKAEQEKLFDVVVMVLVKKNPDLRKIQNKIAYGLGLELPPGLGDESIVDRLRVKFLKERKVLVILDDIWDKLDLEALGIPFEDQQQMNVETGSSSTEDQQMKCKIVLSSRELHVLSTKMGTQKKVAVGLLKHPEAWQMFKQIVGDRAESPELQPTGIEIVKKCGRLPVAIAALAEALKDKNPYEWRSALQKLRHPSPSNFTGVYEEVYTAIEVSYNHLGSEELKTTFLLSSLMGHNASIRDLLKYGVGLDLFSQANTIEGARDDVLTLISNLKAASLLIDGSDNEHFGIHDVIRDVAVSLASRDRHGLLLIDENVPKEWSDREAMNEFKWIGLRYANVNELPDVLESSQLTFFYWLNKDPSSEIPANFFKGMQRLKVLDLTGFHLSPLPSSICLLKNLHTLCLDQSVLGDIHIIGKLKNLKVLSLLKSDLEKLPLEIGQLTQLKLLDLSYCTKLKVIPPGVLASLTKLEELLMVNSFHQWEHEVHENKENASLAELKHLKKLIVLEICIPNVQMIPTDLFSEKLKNYRIIIGDEWNKRTKYSECSRILKLQLKACICFDRSVKRLLKMTEELHLEELNGVKNVVEEFDSEGFKDLKYLYVGNASEVQHIISSVEGVLFNAFPSLEVLFLYNLIKLEKIFQGWFKETALNKLREITVECCHELKNLFSFSVAKQLLQLQHITVRNCSNMEEIVDNEEQGSGDAIVGATEGVQRKFGGQLRSLRLQDLAKLTHFNGSCRRMTLFNEVLPHLEEMQLSLINVNTIWHASLASSSVEKLTKLTIQGCHSLEYLFSFSMIQYLVKLGHLEIKECKRMREVVITNNVEEEEKMIFPQLNFFFMEDLQSLVGFHLRTCIVEFPSLKQLGVKNCPNFKGFTVTSITTDVATIIQPLFNEQVAFLNLERITVTHLKNLTTLWHDNLHANSFCKLKSLEVIWCEELSTIWPSDNMLGSLWTSLEELRIVGCSLLEVIFRIREFNATSTPVVMDTQLRVLDIQNLPRLKHVWDKDPKGILTFHNLESVKVSNCQSLNNLFPTSVAKGLLQLQHLEIYHSGLEEIVAMGGVGIEEVVKFEFPRVSSLVLWNLTRFRHFYPGECRTEWPMLKRFLHFNCGKIKKRNEQEGQLDFPVQQPLFCVEKVIPQLETLSLSKDDIAMLCGEYQLKHDIFFNIKLLQIQDYLDQSAVLPIHFLHRFSNLENIVLINCHFIELFPSKGDQFQEQEKHVETLSRVRELHLVNISNLKHILTEASSSVLQNLQILRVVQCQSLLCLSTYKAASFQNLTDLYVSGCYTSLIRLVLVSTAQCLVQLERMTVRECHSLIEIVGSEGDGIEDSIIYFSKLRFLKLECLLRLESFCLGNFIFKFPSLEKVIVDQCPILKIFCDGGLDTPVLRRVDIIEGEDKWLWAGDLNTTIQRMFKEKVRYAGLKNLILSDFPELMEIWHIKKPQEISLDWRMLLHLHIYDCSNFTYLLTPSMVSCLVQLVSIEVKDCEMMEQVMVGDEKERKMIFPQLKWITLHTCSNLTTFYAGSYSLEIPALTSILVNNCPKMATFTSTSSREHEKEASQYFFSSKVEIPILEELILSSINLQQIWQNQPSSVSSFAQNLSRLIVTNCGHLRYLFTSSIIKSFAQLKVLEIRGCEVMDVIILMEGSNEEEELDRMCQTMFPELEILVLDELPQLVRFCSNNDSLGEISNPEVLNRSKSQVLLAMQSTSVKTEDTKIIFPRVTHLKLEVLPKFKSFFTKTHITEWPSLERIFVHSCDIVQIFASKFSSAKTIHTDNQLDSQTQHPLFWISKDSFPCLEELKLGWNDGMEEIWHDQYLGDYFPKLKHLELIQFQKLPSFFFQLLPSLEKLIVSEASFAEIFQCERLRGEERPGDAPYLLRELKLSKLSKLRHLWKEETSFKHVFYNLRTLEVLECCKLMNLVPYIASFENLQILKVSKCHGLVNLMSYSTAKTLVELTKMSIIDCDMIEEIVECLEDDVKDGIVFTKLKYLQLCGLPRLVSFCSKKCNFEFSSLDEVIVEGCPRMKIFSVGEVRTSQLGRVQFIKDKDTWRWEGDLNTTIQKLFTEKVAYFELENLKLYEFPELIEIWNKNHEEILSFKKLQYLEVYNCSSLTYLLTPSMAFGLVQLKDLKIKDCATMEQVIMVIGVEEVIESGLILFPQLKSISLKSCPKLSSFYVGSNTLKFPILEKITVKDCLKMVRFTSKFLSEKMIVKEELDIFIEAFFGDEVEILILKMLTLSSINIKQIWNNQLSSISSFAQHLTELTVVNCSNLKYLFTFSMVKSFVQLEELEISGCEMMEVVILIEGTVEEEKICQTVFPKLDALALNDLPQLATFCSNSDSLGEIFDSERDNIGTRSQKLLATQSTLVETKATKLVFTQMTSLVLRLLPKFKSFFPQMHITEWPSLEVLVVIECHGAQIIASKFSGIEMTHGDNQLERESQHLMFWISKATFPRLKCVVVKWNDNMKIQCGHHLEEYFGELEVLYLLGFPKQSAFLSPFFFYSLPNLKNLLVKDAFFDEIFKCEKVTSEEKPVCGRTPLSKLRLSKLHELTHLWKEESQLKVDILNNLTILKVQECIRLKNLVPSTVHFDNLRTLVISECHGLVNLVRYSTAKSLAQLKRMKVANCEMMEEIVVCLGDVVKDGIVFTKLECLQLKGLPRLESFCSGICNFKFPALEEVIVTECANMQTFSKEELSTPELQEVKLIGDIDEDKDVDIEKLLDDYFHKDEDEDEGVADDEVEVERCWVGNLNSTIQQLFKEKSDHNSKKGNGENSDHDSKEDGN